MATPPARRQSVVIDLVSDDEDIQPIAGPARQNRHPPEAPRQAAAGAQDFGMDDFIDFDGLTGAFPFEAPPQPVETLGSPPPENHQLDGEYLMIDGEEVFIPNSPGIRARSNDPQPPQNRPDGHVARVLGEQSLTVDDCLQYVLAIFPDVSHEHVRQLYSDIETTMAAQDRIEHVVNKLLSEDSYPKQDKGKKRKRDEEAEKAAERKRWEGPNREVEPHHLKGTISSMLKAEFPEATHNLISELLQTHKHLYPTFVALAKSKDGRDAAGWRGRAPKGRLADADTIAANSGWNSLSDELQAARKQVERIRADRRAEDAKNQAEQENLQRAIEAGETAECQACFEDLPMNRQIHCNGDVAHFTCFDCAETYIKSEVGDSRCRVLCTAGCGAGFAHAQLHQLSDKGLLAKLEQLQQEKDIRDAGLDDLEECPFCDYKAILPPVEEDFEFRCMNPSCEKISCRRCKAVSHIPMSCEDHAKDNKINARHKIEEAMTAAMIRSCNKCKKHFIKEYGCNKMSCPSCGNLQCYVCSESLKNYDHFDQGGMPQPNGPGRKKCPLYDNVEERHEREVKEAEAAARAQAMSENPDVSEKDLEIKVSDAVQKATRDRIQRGAVGPGGIPAPPPIGGLFARVPHFPRYLANDGADDDENIDYDLDVFAGDFFDAQPWRRHHAGRRRAPNAVEADHNHAGAGVEDPRIPADPHLRGPQAIGVAAAHAAPANPAIPRVQGFIPVFGMQPHMAHARQAPAVPAANANAAAQQPAVQVRPAAAHLGPHGLLDNFGGLFGADPFGNDFAIVPPFMPQPPEQQDRPRHHIDQLAGGDNMQDRLRGMLQAQQQQALAAARQQQQLQVARLRQAHQQRMLQLRQGQNEAGAGGAQYGGWAWPGDPRIG